MNNNIYVCAYGLKNNVNFVDILKTTCEPVEFSSSTNGNVVWIHPYMENIYINFVDEKDKEMSNIILKFYPEKNTYSIHKNSDLLCVHDEQMDIEELSEVSRVKLCSDEELLNDEQRLEGLAKTYLGKIWAKKIKNNDKKYMYCIKQLREKYQEIMADLEFMQLKDTLLTYISNNHVDYLLRNNLLYVSNNYDDLIQFCRHIDETYGYSIYENDDVKKILLDHLTTLCNNPTNLEEVENVINDMYSDRYSKIKEMYGEHFSIKMLEMKNKFVQYIEKTPILNINDLFNKHEYMKKYNISYDMENLIIQNIDMLCYLDTTDALKLYTSTQNIMSIYELIQKKIRYVCDKNNYDIESKLCYLYNLRKIMDDTIFKVDNKFKLYINVERYIQHFMTQNIVHSIDRENRGILKNISCELEKIIYEKNIYVPFDMSEFDNRLSILEEKYKNITKEYETIKKNHEIYMSDRKEYNPSNYSDNTEGKQVKYIIKNSGKGVHKHHNNNK